MGLFRKRVAVKNERSGKEILKMVNIWGEQYYKWDGKLYNSDIVRSCLRPKVRAVGKLAGKHIRDSTQGLKVNPDANIRFLFSEPNPFIFWFAQKKLQIPRHAPFNGEWHFRCGCSSS